MSTSWPAGDTGSFDTLPRTLTSDGSANFRVWKLVFSSPDVAVFRPTGAVRGLFAAFLVMGAGAMAAPLVFGTQFFDVGDDSAAPSWLGWSGWFFGVVGTVFPMVIGLVFVIIGLRGVFGKTAFGMGAMVFDRRRGLAWKEGRTASSRWWVPGWLWRFAPKVDRRLEEGLRLRDVAAVQICSGLTNVPEPGKPNYRELTPYWTFEINLVLSSPAGQRVHVASHAAEAALRYDARQLAEFLRVPLLDHSTEQPEQPKASKVLGDVFKAMRRQMTGRRRK